MSAPKETVDVEIQDRTDGTVDEKPQLKPDLVTWNGDDDSTNPQNWSARRKWTITMVLSGFSVLPPLSSTIISPAQFAIKRDLGIRSEVVLQICLSVFNLGIGFGPLIMSPLSETYGRYPVVIVGNVFFLAWNTACGFVGNEPAFIVCRLFTGLGSTASLSVMAATMGDIWPPEKRATAIGMATFFPLFGPALGPIIGGYVAQYSSWRWILWATSIADAVMLTIGIVFLRETYAPKLLRAKAEDLRKTTGDNGLHSAYDHDQAGLAERLRKSFLRPFQILYTQTVVQIICLLLVMLYGTMFLNFYSFPILWTNIYHQATGRGSLNYISTAVGCFTGSQVISRLNDLMYRTLKCKNGNKGRPELRLPLIFVCSLLVGIGLVILGWTGQFKYHWILPNIGNALFLAGATGMAQVCATYTVDAYAIYAASAASSQNFLRSVASFTFPMFGPAMYRTLGWGGTSTLLGLGTTLIALISGVLLWSLGPRLRERQKLL